MYRYSDTPILAQKLPHLLVRSYARGETITTSADIEGVYFIKQGFVKRFAIKNDGSINVLGISGSGEMIGIAHMLHTLSSRRAYDGEEIYYIEAINDVEIYAMPEEQLLSTLAENEAFYKDLFTMVSSQYASDLWLLENRSLSSAMKRVAHLLIFYLERYGQKSADGWRLVVPLTQQDLADILDLTRETVSLAISELRNKKVLEGSRTLLIPDLDILRTVAYS